MQIDGRTLKAMNDLNDLQSECRDAVKRLEHIMQMTGLDRFNDQDEFVKGFVDSRIFGIKDLETAYFEYAIHIKGTIRFLNDMADIFDKGILDTVKEKMNEDKERNREE